MWTPLAENRFLREERQQMNVKTEKWNGHEIRFVWHDGEWWAVAKDVAKALGYNHVPHMVRMLKDYQKNTVRLTDSNRRGNPNVTIISETGIYKVIMRSDRPEAEEFEIWVYKIIKELRQQTGLEGFQVFRMLDKEHQKEMMSRVARMKSVDRVDYIKANTIANKVVSTRFGFPKMIKKGEMTPEMLKERQAILEDTVNLMWMRNEYDLDFSVSDAVKKKWH